MRKYILVVIFPLILALLFSINLPAQDEDESDGEPLVVTQPTDQGVVIISNPSTISLPKPPENPTDKDTTKTAVSATAEDVTSGTIKVSDAIDSTPTPSPTPTPYMKRQIAIEALVVEVGENLTREVGFRYGFTRDNKTNPNSNLKGIDINYLTNPNTLVYIPGFQINDDGTYSLPLDSSVAASPGVELTLGGMNIGPGELSAILKAYLQTGDAEIRSQPITVALEGTEAQIQTIDEIPFQDVKFIGSKSSPFLDISFENVGITCNVVPSIEGEKKDMIRLKLNKLEVSEVSSYLKDKQITRPIVAKAQANTEVVLKDRETLVLGGLKSERESESIERLPLLGKIPVIGIFFRYKKTQTEKTDVYFFITPTILETGENPLFPKDFANIKEATKAKE